ncbi:MAG: MBL fold metallo-hydrolase [Actinobacteria bacterium]|nr:MAG: MBL fold metallo-hydrolase [Actinomycetota bacterium]
MQVETLTVGPLGTNCYIVASDDGTGAVLDPGDDSGRILDRVRARGIDVRYVINTHGHADHTSANGDVVEATGAKLVIGREDARMLTDPVANISAFLGERPLSPEAEVLVDDGDELGIGPVSLRFLHTPGHTAGSLVVLADGALFSGDTLFAGSVGRTDLPGGSSRRLSESLRTKLLPLPDSTIVYPGHGEPSTIGREKAVNPFLQGDV